MNNLQKRILTSLIILPLSILFIFKGGQLLLLFLFAVFFIANYELFSVFKKKAIILFLDLLLILSLFLIYYLRHFDSDSFKLLFWVIILCILSDVGGYFFGKTFNWKKLTKISPNKTLSGVLGSFLFSLFSVFFVYYLWKAVVVKNGILNFFHISCCGSGIKLQEPKYLFLAIIFSLVVQMGDLTISYFKRLERIKDTGKTLPGHGGIFDRIDGLMFAIILAFVLYQLNIIP